MKLINLLTLLILFSNQLSFSQDNNANIWYFGNNAGVDFNTGVPTGIIDGQINTKEGCASICDIDGNILFYSDGSNIWNSEHDIMPNGSGLLGDFSATQSSVIVPRPHFDGANSIYYVFTIDNWQDDLVNGFRYSVVDMSLDGGLGDVVDTLKNITLHDAVSEKICAVMHTNNKDVWVLTHDWDSDQFLSYLLTEDSISSSPIISAVGSVHGGEYVNALGYMKASIAGDKVGLVHPISDNAEVGNFEVLDFDRGTGLLSNYRVSDNVYKPYGVEFSPDGNKLYTSCMTWDNSITSKLYQFDLQADDFASSETLIEESYSDNIFALQLGPNGKIYVAINNNTFLASISDPNTLGLDCNYESQDVYLDSKVCRYGLPNQFYYKGFQFFTGSNIDVSICDGDSMFLDNEYQSTEGTFQDIVDSYLGWDSIINIQLSLLDALPIPVITANSNILSSNNAPNYQWYFEGEAILNAIYSDFQAMASGTYQVVIENENGCQSWSAPYSFTYVGVNELKKSLNIYPNPTTGIINIDTKETYSVEIFDLKGQVLIEDNAQQSLDISFLKKGIYLLKIVTQDQVYTSKIYLE